MPKLRTAALVGLALVPVACGGGGASGDEGPASLVPADATFYGEVVVRPDGSLRDDAHDAAGKVLLTDDPAGEIRKYADLLFGGDLDYDQDVEPWLGDRAAIWVPPTAGDDDPGVVLLAATDADQARESVEAALRRNGGLTERSHRGHEYVVGASGMAAGVIEDFVALGREANYKRTVDAAEGDSLAEAERYSDAVDGLEDERLAHFWLDSAALFEAGLAADPELRAQAEELSSILPVDELPPVAGSFTADGDGLRLEARAAGIGERRGFGSMLGGGSSPLLQELPGDSWLALGSADVGESLRETVDGLGGAFGGIAVRRELERETGLDLDRDLLDWIGHVGLFVRGTNPETIDGGVVIQPTDEDRAADAFGRIVGAIQMAMGVRAQPVDVAGADQAFEIGDPRSPVPFVLARGSGLVAITMGRPAAEAALGSDDRLGDTDLYSEAEDLVGMEPSALLSMDHVIELAAGNPDPEFQEARPYLEAFSVLALGVMMDGDEGVARVAGGLDE